MAHTTRRDAIKLGTAAATALALESIPHTSFAAPTQAQPALRMLPLGEVKPAGWLARQLRVQADGMGGHLDEFWPDVGPNSGWLGGTGESWERGPYFVDGLLPLAWLLDDARLKAKAQRFVDWTLTHQRADGMIGPAANDDWWPRMVMCKVLAQYYEVSRDPRVLPVLTRYFHYQLAAMPARPLESWGKYRWQDEALVVLWLFERTHDPELLRLVALLDRQGCDWQSVFADYRYTGPTPKNYLQGGLGPDAMQTHGVNNGQALKVAAVQYLASGDPAQLRIQLAAFARQLAALDRYHGLPSGIFSCDEHLAGLNPSHGSELCTVVETMFSLEVALSVFGDAAIGDRLEKLAFNTLPGAFDDAMWAHQYDQQPNQIQVGLLSKPWTTNGPESNLYGLEPNFGCCTANFHQGWPKFTASLWMRSAPQGSQDAGLVAAAYAPCDVRTDIHGVPVHIAEETDYPFRETIRLTINPATPLRFPLSLRIPGWAAKASVKVNGTAIAQPLTPATFACLNRTWHPGDVVEATFPMPPRVTRWFNRSIALERGPLVFSLDPGQHWVKLRDRPPTADWQVYPTGQWNYALQVDEATAPSLKVTESPVGQRPFASASPPVRIEAPVVLLDAWLSEDGIAQPPPSSPVVPAAGHSVEAHPVETVTLVPYAGAKLRITAFPETS